MCDECPRCGEAITEKNGETKCRNGCEMWGIQIQGKLLECGGRRAFDPSTLKDED